jgi:HAD superfamily hydrolase (TIGR01509 family)
MTRPSAVVFDLGKVLVDFDYSVAGRRIAARGKMSASEVQEFIDHSPLLFRFETGQIGKEQFFAEVQAATGFHGSIDEFCRFFADIFTPIEPMVKLHGALRRRGVPTYIFSNTNELAVGHIRRSFPFFSDFNGYILSYEHGAMKPDARLYEVVERKTQLRGADLFYLDDRAENVATGAARGWHAVVHQTAEQTREMVVRNGLLGEG